MSNGLRDIAIGRGHLLTIALEDLVPDDLNLRMEFGDIIELAKSLAENGQKEPLTVRSNGVKGKAVVVDGHRRLQAAQIANRDFGAQIAGLLCIVEKRGTTEEQRIIDMLLHNSGKPLEPLEEARAFARLSDDYHWTAAMVAKMIGKSESFVAARIKLNRAPADVQAGIREGRVTPTAGAKLAAASKETREKVLAEAGEGKVDAKKVDKATKGRVPVTSTGRLEKLAEQLRACKIEDPQEKAFMRGVLHGLDIAMERKPDTLASVIDALWE